jgi:hypothetical protein
VGCASPFSKSPGKADWRSPVGRHPTGLNRAHTRTAPNPARSNEAIHRRDPTCCGAEPDGEGSTRREPAVVLTTRLDPFAARPNGQPGGQGKTAAALPATLDLDERAVYEVVRKHGTVPTPLMRRRGGCCN